MNNNTPPGSPPGSPPGYPSGPPPGSPPSYPGSPPGSPPELDEVPELTPDNGSVNSSSSLYSSDAPTDPQKDAQLSAGWRRRLEELQGQEYPTSRLAWSYPDSESESDDVVHIDNRPASSFAGGPSQDAIHSARRAIRERLANLMARGEPRSTGPVRPSSRSDPEALPARGYCDSPHVQVVPEYRGIVANQRSQEGQEQRRRHRPRGQGPPPEQQAFRPPRAQNSTGPRFLTPTPRDDIDIAALDLGPPLVRMSNAHTTTESGPGALTGSVTPQVPAGQAQQAGGARARFRGFWRGVWQGIRGRRHRGSRNEQGRSAVRNFFRRRR